eukprot:159822_1
MSDPTTRFAASPDVVDIVFISTTAVVEVVGSIFLCIMWLRRTRAPLHARRLDLVFLSQIMLLSFVLWNGLNEISGVRMLCISRRLIEPLHVVVLLNIYGARLWMIWLAHARQRKAGSIRRPPRSAVKLWICAILRSGWLWTVLAGLECVPFVLNVLVTPSLTDYPDNAGRCGGTWSEKYRLALNVVYGFAFSFAACNFVDLNDEFHLKSEFRAAGISVCYCLAAYFCFFIGGIRKYFPVYDIVELTAAVVVFGCSTAMPVLVSFRKDPKGDMPGSPKSLKHQLSRVLASKNCREYFRKHLMREFCVENLMFYDEAMKYRADAQCVLSDPRMLVRTACSIFDQFIRPGSKNEINISAAQRQAITKAMMIMEMSHNAHIQLQCPDPEIFQCAMDEVFLLMCIDSFMRYRDSNFPHPEP